ncbi:MAG: VOC family protein [Thermoflavifilum sp.]|nr:VOC family protein [Thermoflavifilum sp.]
MYKIIPHLWFNKEAKEAAAFYCSLFPDAKITSTTTLHHTPSGDADVVSFTIWGHPFMAISAGPYFQFNPSISFLMNFDPSREKNARELLDEVWNKLSEGATVLMPLDKYPFSSRYGWIQDKYGVSWQLMLTNPDGEPRPNIIPFLMFVGNNCGKAEEARNFYLSVFRNAQPGALFRYGSGQEPNKEGTIMFTDFMLENTWFAAIDSAHEHLFSFNEAISFMINCNTQEEIDYYWNALSAVPEAEQCGWCKDRYGLSWQISPTILQEMITKGSDEQVDRVTQAFLKMKKFNIEQLKQAYTGS